MKVLICTAKGLSPHGADTVNRPHESGFRYVLHGKGDANRELTLTVLVFHVPK